MRILRWLVVGLLGLVVLVTLASLVFDLVTSDPNVPVTKLWHGRFVRADGVLTAYRSWGTTGIVGAQGAPVVLLGGFVEPSFVWEQVGPLLASGHRVYALDLDGFGYSQRRGPWTLQEWADQVQAFMTHLGIDKPIVVGTRREPRSRSSSPAATSPPASCCSTATRSRSADRRAGRRRSCCTRRSSRPGSGSRPGWTGSCAAS